MNRTVHLSMRDLLEHVTCKLCGGYYVDATTVVECLHSFCRTCIVQHLADNRSCPVCDIQIHKTRPLLNIKHDQTLQDIVYRLVPGLRKNEMKRRKKFWGERDDTASWKHLALEDLGEWDEREAGWKKRSKKICLSIEPSHLMKNMLSADSEWKEVDKPIAKRYIRCSQDVTVHHLHKFLKIKLKEKEATMILLFHKNNVLQESYSLGDILETFPCKFNEILDLTYSVYLPKESKAPFTQSAENAIVPAPKKRRLPSATPQLQAFFNSQLNPRSTKVENPKPTAAVADAKVVTAETDLNPNPNPDPDPVPVERESNGSRESTSIDRDTSIPKDSSPQPEMSDSNDKEVTLKNDTTSVPVQSPLPEPASEEEQTVSNIVSESETPSAPLSSSSSQQTKKQCEPVQCYQMRTIPVSEAVRSKPPTPVETTPVYHAKEKRTAESKSSAQSAVNPENYGVKAAKNRRKASTPIQHTATNSSPIPKAAFISEKKSIDNVKPTSKISPSAQSGKFILLSSQHPQINVTPSSNPISSISSSSRPFISKPNQMINLHSHTRVDRSLSPGTSAPQSLRPNNDQKNLTSAARDVLYQKLSTAQAHLRALDAARNVMQLAPKRPAPSKRPILPKTSNSPTFVPQKSTGDIKRPGSAGADKASASETVVMQQSRPKTTSTNKPRAKVFVPKPFLPKSVPLIKPKESVSSHLLTTLTKPPGHSLAPHIPSRGPPQRPRTTSFDRSHELLKKMSAAVAKSNMNNKTLSAVPKNGPPPPPPPPPPYDRVTGSVVFSGASSHPGHVGPRGHTPNTSNFNLTKLVSSRNEPGNKMLVLARQTGARFSSPAHNAVPHAQSSFRVDVFSQSSRDSGISSSKKQQPRSSFIEKNPSTLQPIAPHIKTSKNTEQSYNPSLFFPGYHTGFRKGYRGPSTASHQDISAPNLGTQPNLQSTTAPLPKPRNFFPLNRQLNRMESNKLRNPYNTPPGSSGSFYNPAITSPSLRTRTGPRLINPLGSSSPTPSVFSRQPSKSTEKRHIYPPLEVPRSPPAGTKSPWSSRGFILPPVEADFQSYPPTKKPCLSSPGLPSDAIRPSPSATSSDGDFQPLELTVKASRTNLPLVASQTESNTASADDPEQPLCLIVKKH